MKAKLRNQQKSRAHSAKSAARANVKFKSAEAQSTPKSIFKQIKIDLQQRRSKSECGMSNQYETQKKSKILSSVKIFALCIVIFMHDDDLYFLPVQRKPYSDQNWRRKFHYPDAEWHQYRRKLDCGTCGAV